MLRLARFVAYQLEHIYNTLALGLMRAHMMMMCACLAGWLLGALRVCGAYTYIYVMFGYPEQTVNDDGV